MRFLNSARDVTRVSVLTCIELYKVLIPVIILIKILQETGWIRYLARPLSPVMELVGLPPGTGLAWALSLASGVNAGLLVLSEVTAHVPTWTVAQATTLGAMMLVAHNLPVELRVAQKCGANPWFQMGLRVAAAVALGGLIHYACSRGHWLQEPARIILLDPGTGHDTLWIWVLGELKKLVVFFFIILALNALLRTLEWLRILDLLHRALAPLLRMLGMSREAGSITLIGLTLGLALGGGLIIQEARSGRISRRDVTSALTLMALSHSLIDDTLLVGLMGAHMTVVLLARLAFSLVVVAAVVRISAALSGPPVIPSESATSRPG